MIKHKEIKRTVTTAFLMILITLMFALCGCGQVKEKGDPLTDYVSHDLYEAIENGYAPEAIRYTVYDSTSDSYKTYITSDSEIISELMAALKDSRVQYVELAVMANQIEDITFCGTIVSSNGDNINSHIRIYDRYFCSGVNCFALSNSAEVRDLIDKIVDTGRTTFYTVDIETTMDKITGYWLGDDSEISIYQGKDGYYHFRASNSDGSVDDIFICSIEKTDGNYDIYGLDEMARDYRISFRYSSSQIEYNGNTYERAMME